MASKRVSEELAREFTRIAAVGQMSKSALMAEAIKQYIDEKMRVLEPNYIVGREDAADV